ncbi:protein of unknown function [Nitrospina watsonii]|uniref:Uncharacterized protein n=1 Tax=Nitrospina watsonii TaxID=1323948 RepID=A0ABM9HGV4_9BACT|nr:protein of unknown function [Nitrospina watsonii]
MPPLRARINSIAVTARPSSSKLVDDEAHQPVAQQTVGLKECRLPRGLGIDDIDAWPVVPARLERLLEVRAVQHLVLHHHVEVDVHPVFGDHVARVEGHGADGIPRQLAGHHEIGAGGVGHQLQTSVAQERLAHALGEVAVDGRLLRHVVEHGDGDGLQVRRQLRCTGTDQLVTAGGKAGEQKKTKKYVVGEPHKKFVPVNSEEQNIDSSLTLRMTRRRFFCHSEERKRRRISVFIDVHLWLILFSF